MNISSVGLLASAEDLSEVQKLIGHPFPEDYKDFLKTHNGGRPEESYLKWGEGHYNGTSIQHFFSVGELYSSYLNSQGKIPPDMIPVAKDEGGNLILMSLLGDSIGNIYFWDHERPDDVGQGTRFVSKDFSSMISRLTIESKLAADADEINLALTGDNVNKLRELIDDGLSINYMDSEGVSLIEKSAMFSLPSTFKYLLDSNADIGRSMEFARKLNRSKIIRIFNESS